jgi:hypothetical protein
MTANAIYQARVWLSSLVSKPNGCDTVPVSTYHTDAAVRGRSHSGQKQTSDGYVRFAPVPDVPGDLGAPAKRTSLIYRSTSEMDGTEIFAAPIWRDRRVRTYAPRGGASLILT